MQVRGYGAIHTTTEIIASDTTITSRSVKSHAGMRCWGMAFTSSTVAITGLAAHQAPLPFKPAARSDIRKRSASVGSL